MGRTRFDIADIIRCHRPELEAIQPLTRVQKRALSAIALCRTAALGGHVNVCLECGLGESPSYNSCRNRNCPKCQNLAQERWIASRAAAILPIAHYHGVFTLPETLRFLSQRYPCQIHHALFRSSSDALLEMGESRLGLRLGLTTVLHTWNRELDFHPHVHVLISGGGLSLDGARFKKVRKKVLLHVKPLAMLFKGKMMDSLRGLYEAGVLAMTQGAFGSLMACLQQQDWVVYLKRTFHQPEHTLAYLGRYTHRVGIANSRLLDVAAGKVVFRTKDGRVKRLSPVVFLRRFVQHVLPAGFRKIRHSGLYGSPKALSQARTLLGSQPTTQVPKSWETILLELTGRDVTRCAGCGATLYRKLLPAISFPKSLGISRSPP
jgi:hypothetical protein